MKKDKQKGNTGSAGQQQVIPLNNKQLIYPAKGDRCYCGGRLEAVKISEEHYFRCSECGNDYSVYFEFTDTRLERLCRKNENIKAGA